jgi:hypothetical protein
MDMKKTANGLFAKLPFRALAEKIPAGTRAKVPALEKAIPFANQIACVLALVIVATLAACGGGGAKSLAKQTYQLQQNALKAADNPAKAASLAIKAAAVAEKVAKLSESEQAEYLAELARLSGAGGTSSSSGTSSGGKKYVSADKAENFAYDLTADGTGVVIKNMNKPSNGDYYNVIKIPAKIEGYPVVEVQKFNYQALDLSVTFPDTVTKLGEELFYKKKLKTVKLPPKITVIPDNCFRMSSITEIIIPNGVTTIGKGAFWDCSELTTITIPDSVTTIGESVFRQCSELTTVKLPAHPIQYTAGDVFLRCPKLSLAVRKAITDSGYTGEF